MTNGHREINMLRLERVARHDRDPRRVAAHDGSTKPSIVIGSATGNGTDFGPP